jgi:N-acetylneuraminic acid mutarotase
VPGARYFGTYWTDASGNFWLFGGVGFDSTGQFADLNDLWEFSPATSEWTWRNGGAGNTEPGIYGTLGIPSATNVPGARISPANWVDLSGSLWIFGGAGGDGNGTQGDLNDLWRYQP